MKTIAVFNDISSDVSATLLLYASFQMLTMLCTSFGHGLGLKASPLIVCTKRKVKLSCPEQMDLSQRAETANEETPEQLRKIERRIWIWATVLSIIFVFAWPLLALPAGVFSKVS